MPFINPYTGIEGYYDKINSREMMIRLKYRGWFIAKYDPEYAGGRWIIKNINPDEINTCAEEEILEKCTIASMM